MCSSTERSCSAAFVHVVTALAMFSDATFRTCVVMFACPTRVLPFCLKGQCDLGFGDQGFPALLRRVVVRLRNRGKGNVSLSGLPPSEWFRQEIWVKHFVEVCTIFMPQPVSVFASGH